MTYFVKNLLCINCIKNLNQLRISCFCFPLCSLLPGLYCSLSLIYNCFNVCSVCVVYAHVCGARGDAGSLLSRPLPYSSETGSFASPGARLAASKPQSPSYFHLL